MIDAESLNEDHIRNVTVATTWDRRQWSSWLLQLLSSPTGDARPLQLSPQSDAVIEVQRIFRSLDNDAREVARTGVVTALAEWEGFYPLHTFGSLCWVAALVRAADATEPIGEFLLRKRELLSHGEGPEFDVLDDVLGAFTGFAPNPRVAVTVRCLLFEDVANPRYASTLLLGAVACEPQKVAQFLNRFVARRLLDIDYFDDAIIVRRLFDFVSLVLIREQFANLSEPAQDYLLEWGLSSGLIPESELFGLQVRDDSEMAEALPLGTNREFEQLCSRWDALVPYIGNLSLSKDDYGVH